MTVIDTAVEPPTVGCAYLVCSYCNIHVTEAREAEVHYFGDNLCGNEWELRIYMNEDLEDGAAFNPDVNKNLDL